LKVLGSVHVKHFDKNGNGLNIWFKLWRLWSILQFRGVFGNLGVLLISGMERLLRRCGRLLGKILDLNAHTYSDEEWWGELS
jgi:hypothetical protein